MDYIQGQISVIVPAYNVEEYIIDCVESICNQSYKNLEIIIIDDGSTDATGEICDAFDDSRIKVIHQKNQGFSGARNTGILEARGEYLAFVDSDDYIKPDMLEKLVSIMGDKEVSFAACAVEYLRCDSGLPVYSGATDEIKQLDYKESVDYLCDIYLFNVWNKLYRHDLVENIYFDLGVVCEDVGYIRKVFKQLKKTAYIDSPLYVYRIKRPRSSGMSFDDRKLPALEEYEKFIGYLKQKGYGDKCTEIRFHQLAMIKSLYYETEDYDNDNRKKMMTLYKKNVLKDRVLIKKVRYCIPFLLIPGLMRKKYRKMYFSKMR